MRLLGDRAVLNDLSNYAPDTVRNATQDAYADGYDAAVTASGQPVVPQTAP